MVDPVRPVDGTLPRHPAPGLGQPHPDRVGGPPPGRADPGIRFVTGQEVRALRLDRHGDVIGLTMRARGDAAPSSCPPTWSSMRAAASSLPDWLEALMTPSTGGPWTPSRLRHPTYAVPDDFRADWKGTYIQARRLGNAAAGS